MLNVEDRKARAIPRFCALENAKKDGYTRIMCTLDGLICLAPESGYPDPVLIFNPLLKGDYVILPKTEHRVHFYRSQHVSLGFDPLINKYKAVRMLIKGINFLFEVITIGGEEASWRRVDAPHIGVFLELSRGGVFHQGSIYWIIDKHSNLYVKGIDSYRKYCRDYILEFDVIKEVFRVISFPHSMRAPTYQLIEGRMFNLHLQIMEGGSLALMENDGELLHIWRIVKENGNLVVEYSSISIRSSTYSGARVIALLCPNGIDDLLLLERPPGRRWKDEGRERRETQFLYCYPFSSSSKKCHRFVKLSSLQILCHENFIAWYFKPSLVSAKAALLLTQSI